MFSFVFLTFILCNYKYASLSLSLSSILSQTLYLCLSVKILTLSHSQSLCHSAFRDLSFSYISVSVSLIRSVLLSLFLSSTCASTRMSLYLYISPSPLLSSISLRLFCASIPLFFFFLYVSTPRFYLCFSPSISL